MKLRPLLLAVGFIFSTVLSVKAVPLRYEINIIGIVGQFTVDIPSGDAVDPFTEISATDAVGVTSGGLWGNVVYRRYHGTAEIHFHDPGNTSIGLGGPIGADGPIPGRNLADAWEVLVARIPLHVVKTSVPDAGATASLLVLSIGGLALMRRALPE